MGAEVDEEGNPIINASFKKMSEPETELKKRVVVVETKTVASDPNVHDQANMLAYGVELHLTPAEIGGALKSAGFTGFDVNRWDEMKDAITNAAKTKAPVGTNGHEPVAA